jgi:hypothetical protein
MGETRRSYLVQTRGVHPRRGQFNKAAVLQRLGNTKAYVTPEGIAALISNPEVLKNHEVPFVRFYPITQSSSLPIVCFDARRRVFFVL